MTERLYHHDAYLTAFEARIVERADEGRRVYLDRTAFYPDSGGQPHDRGTLNGVEVTGVEDEDGRIAHILAAPAAGDTVQGRIDWARRYDHMQQHSGQHLLSAVLIELFGIHTVSFHMGAESSTIDVVADRLEPERIRAAEERCAELVFANRPITITF
jgi:alanyl-tRNA synthetase